MASMLIGVDGGATKVSAWEIVAGNGGGAGDAGAPTFRLGEAHGEYAYRSIEGYDASFAPVEIRRQLAERDDVTRSMEPAEERQGGTWIAAAVRAIGDVARDAGDGRTVRIGVGLPGLKTADHRGLAVVANGPRIPDYCDRLESGLEDAGIRLAAPVRELGSDADYCGIGEEYAADGCLRPVTNAYYLGGGTGVADAMKLRGNLLPFDRAKPWIAKTWEMADAEGVSFEASTSAKGIRGIYAGESGRDPEELERESVYLAAIAARARAGEEAARRTVEIAGARLAEILAERIETLAAGSAGRTGFVSSARAALEPSHEYLGEVFDRLVLGQRLAETWADPDAGDVYREATLPALVERIAGCDRLTDTVKGHYLDSGRMRQGVVAASPLREAPALGAGVAAWLASSGD